MLNSVLAMAGIAMAAVNVNIAQQSELQGVKGITPVQAKAIIEHRNQNGPYTSVESLDKVIDPATLEKVKPHLALTGDAFVPPPKADKPEVKKPVTAARKVS